VAGSSFALSDDFERKLEAIAANAVREKAAELQRVLDRVSQEYFGRPVDEVKPVQKQRWDRTGGKLTDPDLTKYATLISEGVRIKLRTP
jgi:hypothetical protein